VVEVRLPRLPAHSRQTFKKFRLRNAIDFPIVNVATVVATESGKVGEARIAMGSVAPVILRASGAEVYLVGRELSEQTGREAAELAVAGCMPLGRNGYKVSILRALVTRALLASADGRGKGP
jgi:xanthine dehydrogenase YagS FAD-binding subunit